MTSIKIFYKNNNIVSFEISGHTGYSDYGKDILCASISSFSQMAVLGITKVLHIKAIVNIDDKKGYLKLTLPKDISEDDMQKSQVLLKTMEQSLNDLTFNYGKYINLEVKNEIY